MGQQTGRGGVRSDTEVAPGGRFAWDREGPHPDGGPSPVLGATQVFNAQQLSQVGADLAASWRIKNVVAASRAASWRIRNLVAQSRAASWRIRNLVTQTRSLSWKLRALVTQSEPASWKIVAHVGANLAMGWKLNPIPDVGYAGKRGPTINPYQFYKYRTQVGVSLKMRWSIRRTSSVFMRASWRIRRSVRSELRTTWRIHQTVEHLMALSWRRGHPLYDTSEYREAMDALILIAALED